MISSPSDRSMHDTQYLKPGVILKQRYKIEDVIGSGGFGITYKAWDPLLQAYVAIKEYYPSGVATRAPESSKVCVPAESKKGEYHRGLIRFLKEAQDVARFQSEPNIVSIYDYLEENDTAYMVMEYLHGWTLKQYASEHGGRLSQDFLIHVCLSVTDALTVVHEAGMIHRDISPDNIFVCEDFTIKLIDFGAAKQVYFDREQTLSVILKQGYAPPEQYANKEKQGPWADIYALGATLYYAATGEKPEESISRVLEDTVEAVNKKNIEISESFSYVIMKAMAVKTEERYQSAKELREAVLAGKNSKSIGAKKYIVVGIVCLLVMIAIYIWKYRKQSEQPDEPPVSATTDATVSDAALSHALSDSDEMASTEATATDAKEDADHNSDNTMIMHVPTKEEQEIRDVLTIRSSQSEWVSVDKFEYCPDENRGWEGFVPASEASDGYAYYERQYEGDCILMSLKYMDTLKQDPPSVYDESVWYAFTFKKQNESGQYVTITNEEWEDNDYSSWFSPESLYASDAYTLYIPLDDSLEDGQYQVYFSSNHYNKDTTITIFQATVEFTLHRGK